MAFKGWVDIDDKNKKKKEEAQHGVYWVDIDDDEDKEEGSTSLLDQWVAESEPGKEPKKEEAGEKDKKDDEPGLLSRGWEALKDYGKSIGTGWSDTKTVFGKTQIIEDEVELEKIKRESPYQYNVEVQKFENTQEIHRLEDIEKRVLGGLLTGPAEYVDKILGRPSPDFGGRMAKAQEDPEYQEAYESFYGDRDFDRTPNEFKIDVRNLIADLGMRNRNLDKSAIDFARGKRTWMEASAEFSPLIEFGLSLGDRAVLPGIGGAFSAERNDMHQAIMEKGDIDENGIWVVREGETLSIKEEAALSRFRSEKIAEQKELNMLEVAAAGMPHSLSFMAELVLSGMLTKGVGTKYAVMNRLSASGLKRLAAYHLAKGTFTSGTTGFSRVMETVSEYLSDEYAVDATGEYVTWEKVGEKEDMTDGAAMSKAFAHQTFMFAIAGFGGEFTNAVTKAVGAPLAKTLGTKAFFDNLSKSKLGVFHKQFTGTTSTHPFIKSLRTYGGRSSLFGEVVEEIMQQAGDKAFRGQPVKFTIEEIGQIIVSITMLQTVTGAPGFIKGSNRIDPNTVEAHSDTMQEMIRESTEDGTVNVEKLRELIREKTVEIQEGKLTIEDFLPNDPEYLDKRYSLIEQMEKDLLKEQQTLSQRMRNGELTPAEMTALMDSISEEKKMEMMEAMRDLTPSKPEPVKKPNVEKKPVPVKKPEPVKKIIETIKKNKMEEAGSMEKGELTKAGFETDAMGYGEFADIDSVNGKPVVAYRFSDDSPYPLMGFSVRKDLRGQGVGTEIIKQWIGEKGLWVQSPSKEMMGMLKKAGNIVEYDSETDSHKVMLKKPVETRDHKEATSQVVTELEGVVEVGPRKRTMKGEDPQAEGAWSTEGVVLPDYIPEGLRSRKLLRTALDYIIEGKTPPKGPREGGSRVWQVHQAIMGQIDHMAQDVATQRDIIPKGLETLAKDARSVPLEVFRKEFASLFKGSDKVNYPGTAADFWKAANKKETKKSKPPTKKSRVKDPEDTGMAHRPTQTAPAHDLTKAIPADVYAHPEWYADMSDKASQESVAVIQEIKGQPDSIVDVYRAGPRAELRHGDWVTFSKTYAQREAKAEGVPVHTFKAKADEVFFAGDSLNEFGYFGETITKKTKPKEKGKTPTQKEKVKEVVKGKPKTIKEIAKETKILEPNVRRILGVGTKEGVFERLASGVYTLKIGEKSVAYVMPGDALTELPKLVAKGVKVDMVFLDIPYKTPAITGGNRGMKYEFITVDEFGQVLDSVKQLTKNKDSAIIYMHSQAESGLKKMAEYTDQLHKKGLQVIAKGEWQKRFKTGDKVTNVRGKVAQPEGILLLSESGKITKQGTPIDLNFDLVRPKGYQSEKNAEMIRKMVEMTTKEGDVVLDPFAGSGVVGAEALKAGRDSISIEKKAEVVEGVTKPRIEEAAREINVLEDQSYILQKNPAVVEDAIIKQVHEMTNKQRVKFAHEITKQTLNRNKDLKAGDKVVFYKYGKGAIVGITDATIYTVEKIWNKDGMTMKKGTVRLKEGSTWTNTESIEKVSNVRGLDIDTGRTTKPKEAGKDARPVQEDFAKWLRTQDEALTEVSDYQRQAKNIKDSKDRAKFLKTRKSEFEKKWTQKFILKNFNTGARVEYKGSDYLVTDSSTDKFAVLVPYDNPSGETVKAAYSSLRKLEIGEKVTKPRIKEVGKVLRRVSPIPKLDNKQDGVVVKIKSFGKTEYVPLLERYKGMDIVMAGKDVAVWNKKTETLFRVALDDSKMKTDRVIDEANNNVETAREYIDWVTRPKEAGKETGDLKMAEPKRVDIKDSPYLSAKQNTPSKIGDYAPRVDVEAPVVESLHLHEVVLALAEKYDILLTERYTAPGAKGTYSPDMNLVRVKGIQDISVITHEFTHRLDIGDHISAAFMDDGPIGSALMTIYMNEYPGSVAKKSRAPARLQIIEGYAMLVQRYIEDPGYVKSSYPALYESIIDPGGQGFDPLVGSFIRDMNIVIAQYQSLPALDQVGAHLSNPKKVDKTSTSNEKKWWDFKNLKETTQYVLDNVQEMIHDSVHKVEVASKKAGIHETMADPTVFMHFNKVFTNTLLHNLTKPGKFLTLNADASGLTHSLDFNLATIVEEIKGWSDLKQQRVNNYLIARHIVSEHKVLDQRETLLETVEDALEDLVIRHDAMVKDNEAAVKQGAKPPHRKTDIKAIAKEIRGANGMIRKLKEKIQVSKDILESEPLTKEQAEKSNRACEGVREFQDVATKFDKINDEILKLLSHPEVRILTPRQVKQYKADHPGYAAMKRVFYDTGMGATATAEVQNMFDASRSKKTGKVSSLIARKGGQYTIQWPILSMGAVLLEVQRKSLNQVTFNKLGNADLHKVIPESIRRERYMPHQENDPNFITYYDSDYTKQQIQIDPWLKNLVEETMTPSTLGGFEFARTYTKFFQNMTVKYYPKHTVTNMFFLDPWMAYAFTGGDVKPYVTNLANIGHRLKGKGQEAEWFREYLQDAQSQTRWGWDNELLSSEEQTARFQNELRVSNTLLKEASKAKDFSLTVVGTPSTQSELLTRGSAYVAARRKGKSHILALKAAGDATGSYYKLGSWRAGSLVPGLKDSHKAWVKSMAHMSGRGWLRTLPFANPKTQMFVNTWQKIADKKTRKASLFAMGLQVALGGMAFMAVMRGATEDQKRQMGEIDPSLFSSYLIMPNTLTGKGLIRLRLAEFHSTPLSIINMMLLDNRYVPEYKMFEVEDYFKVASAMVPDQFNPTVGWGRWLTSIMPHPFATAFRLYVGKALFPELRDIEPSYYEKLPPEQRTYENTTLGAKSISKYINQLSEKFDWDLKPSPIQVDAWVQGTLGRATRYLMVGDELTKPIENFFTHHTSVHRSKVLRDIRADEDKINVELRRIKERSEGYDGRDEGDIRREAELMLQKAAINEILAKVKEYRYATGLDQKDGEKWEKWNEEKAMGIMAETYELMDAYHAGQYAHVIGQDSSRYGTLDNQVSKLARGAQIEKMGFPESRYWVYTHSTKERLLVLESMHQVDKERAKAFIEYMKEADLFSSHFLKALYAD